ncbi:cystathionine gamma-synthase [Oleispirillum naphthae]|uniref:cystathionine gamma-synthase n=1 Tax=Oleispirillum naphthae TaxID=2838853 RepID=UPI00308262FA
MTQTTRRSSRTIAARAGIDADAAYGAITPPIVTSSNFSFAGFDAKRTYDYTRSGNPTRDALAGALAELEGGAGAVITATGMSALDLAFGLLSAGDLVLAPHDCYGGTHRLLCTRAAKGHIRVVFADLTDPGNLDAAFAEPPKLVLIETPSNPLLRITDIAAVAARAKAAGALVVADNTFLSPALQQPLGLGADIVVHSLTKYVNGHSDVVGGAVVAKTAALSEVLAALANATGVTGAPFDSWLVLRGLRTLDLRIAAQCKSAAAIAKFLSTQPAVGKVYYPGLADHPGHALAKRQQKDFGAMLSFELADAAAVEPFVDALTRPGAPFSLAESLGGFESLIAHPATMTHAAMDPEARKTAGITDGLLRVSTGLEDVADLKKALKSAFHAIG